MAPATNDAAREARLFSRHLVGVEPGADLVARYAEGCRVLFADRPESPALRAVRRHPFLLRFLDATCALLRRDDPLRERLLLMAAVLETSPAHAQRFLPCGPGGVRLLVRAVVASARTKWALMIGVPLLWWIERGEARRD